MELDYYINQSILNNDSIIKQVNYPAYSSGLSFVANYNRSNSYSYEIPSSTLIEDITVFITIEKDETTAQVLLTNDDSTSGWTIGINSCNFLYLECKYGKIYNQIFDKINLSRKNCLVIKKTSSNFTVYKYDLISHSFESIQSIQIPSEVSLSSSSSVFIAGNNYFDSSYSRNSIGWFSGRIDQLLVVNESLDEVMILKLLLGFQPFYINQSVSTSYILTDSSVRFDNSVLEDYYANYTGYLSHIDSGIVSSLGEGKWIGSFSGRLTQVAISGSGLMSTGINACLGTGAFYTGGFTGLINGYTGYTGYFSDFIRYTKNPEFGVISHSISISGLYGAGVTHLDYDAYYKLYSITGITSSGVSGDYYTGFKMNGITSEYSDLVILGTETGISPSQFNLRGEYNYIYNEIYLNDFTTGFVYLNGERLDSGYYSISNGILQLSGDLANNIQYVIYDKSNTLSLIYLGSDNYAIGDFYPNSSLVWTGISSYTGLARADRDFYKETSSHHLYHGVKIQNTDKVELFKI